ncbi:PREDICTED: uncharacterized protein LOC109472704 isoform X1 [Branchiostoma belcheri]|uniref:Uncharacterized protein LOC109472704 isoform X1 n=1 Tax=Branchiostoma belcheri TaxID=7741 RepID=A0A6P4ZEL9_BRABE|nr:PREDICTED: uncharacterized protein LOC109472704 isoform X1 [Branchiostoma belcheri]
MGKRGTARKKPIWRRSSFAADTLLTDTALEKTETKGDAQRKLNYVAPKLSSGDEVSRVNTNFLPGQGAQVPIHFVVLLVLFLLTAFLIFCRGRRYKSAGSKSSKAGQSRRSSAATNTNNAATRATKKVTSSDKRRNSLGKKDASNNNNNNKPIRRSVSNYT